ncbi:hypothetical protein EG328_002899 [Venturia inaequalis]|uniref:Proline iminopeptidase n=1 Tax=Venturia inaequalis TaxID=5025 RepID=A0A8H3UUL7_VENIN|nr:hypothetical protein EG328_002899 [Venturia inaequalis]
MPSIYPAFATNKSGCLKVDHVHDVYWEECGNPDGLPVIYVHGGPGGGIDDDDRRYFDPSVYRSVLFDQRGCGRSTPAAELTDNTTWHLVSDMEKLRESLAIEKWVVFGGSWGSTLSLAYAEKHPNRCLGLILRGIFTLRREELLWFYQKGADFLFPDFFEDYKKRIPVAEQGDMMAAYYKRLTGDNEEEKLDCADAWSRWEAATSKLLVDPDYVARVDDPKFALAFARIECHYFVNGGFMEDGELLKPENIAKIKHLPISIVQGRYDVVCPAITSWELYKALGGDNILEDALFWVLGNLPTGVARVLGPSRETQPPLCQRKRFVVYFQTCKTNDVPAQWITYTIDVRKKNVTQFGMSSVHKEPANPYLSANLDKIASRLREGKRGRSLKRALYPNDASGPAEINNTALFTILTCLQTGFDLNPEHKTDSRFFRWFLKSIFDEGCELKLLTDRLDGVVDAHKA